MSSLGAAASSAPGTPTTTPPCSASPARDVEGNVRLTSATGMILLVMLAVEGFTLLDVDAMLTLHTYLGILLIGPVLVKLASTGYRFARYYSGDESYRERGAPHIVLRVLGPVMVVSIVSLLGTGIAIVMTDSSRDGLLVTAHQASFWVWGAATTVHVLGHLGESVQASWRDLRRMTRRGLLRWTGVTISLVLAVGVVAVVAPSVATWRSQNAHAHHRSER